MTDNLRVRGARHNDWRDHIRWDWFFWPGLIIVYALYILAWNAAIGHAEIPWTNPGSDPFRGSLDDAVSKLVDAGAPPGELDELTMLYRDGRCAQRVIRPGERISLMTFGGGVLSDVVATTYEPTIDCESVLGAHLLRPLICSNFSYVAPPWAMYVPPAGWFGGPEEEAWWPGESEFVGPGAFGVGVFGSSVDVGSFSPIGTEELTGGSNNNNSVSSSSSNTGPTNLSSINNNRATNSVYEPESLSLVMIPLIMVMLWRKNLVRQFGKGK